MRTARGERRVGTARSPAPLADRIGNGFVWLFAGWTALSIATVAAGGSLRQLVCAAAVAAVLATVVAMRRRTPRAAAFSPPGPADAATRAADPPRTPSDKAGCEISKTHGGFPPSGSLRLAVLLAALLAVGLFAARGLVSWWVAAVALGTALAVREWAARPLALPARQQPWWEATLFALAGLCAALALIAHRPALDDAFYVSLGVAAADAPGAPLLAGDPMHGIAGLPLLLPVYRVHSLEVLEGAIAWLTGWEALTAAHLVVPAVAGFLLPLAWASLFRRVIGGRWIWGVAVVLLFYLGVGEPPRGYANFGLVHLQHGKSIFVSVGIPLLLACAFDYGLAPRPRGWWRLAAAQLACVGLTSSALWMAPALAGLALVCCTRTDARSLGRFASGLSASCVVLGLALWAGGPMLTAPDKLPSDWIGTETARGAFVTAWVYTFARGPVTWLALWVLAGGWSLATSDLLRRVHVVLPLGYLLLLWNPFSAGWLAGHLTGVPTYWRVFWVLPFPLLLATALTSPLELFSSRVARRAGSAAALVVAGAALVWAPHVTTFSTANKVRLARPGWKVPPDALAVVRSIAARAGRQGRVLAPLEVAPWIPTLRAHPTPIVVRPLYLRLLAAQLGTEEAARREQLSDIVSGVTRPPEAGELLAAAVRDYDLNAVCLAPRAASRPELTRALTQAGMRPAAPVEGYAVWVR